MDNFVNDLFLLYHWIILLWFLTKFSNNSIGLMFLVHATNNSMLKFPNFKYPFFKKIKEFIWVYFLQLSNLLYLKKREE